MAAAHGGVGSSSASSSASAGAAPSLVVRCTITGPQEFTSRLDIHRPLSVLPSPPEAIDDAPYSHGYTGRHDGGTLPPVRTDNVYGHVLSALLEAKTSVDAEIQKLLPPPQQAAQGAAQAAAGEGSGGGQKGKQPQKKRPKQGEEGNPGAAGQAKEQAADKSTEG